MKDPESVERQDRIRDLFDRASARSADERDAFLAEACGGDRDLHREVSSLLDETEAADSPLQGLVNEMLWPALESIGSNPSNLENWLDDASEAGGIETDPLVGTTVSHFEIIAPIGRGGMGMVYEARDIKLGRTVALKFLPPAMGTDKAAKDRFMHEAQAASGLDHPNIAAVHEIGETDNHQLFIAMGFYPGEAFTKVIDRGPVPVETVIEIALQMAAALEVVHQNGIVHRDIKPGNLMVAEDGSVKLLDFGLAKLSYATGHTQVGQMIGTVAYMSPEQAKGEAVDHRTDIWSLGVVLYEALSGKRPFDRGDVQSTIHAILDADPEPPKAPDGEIPGPLTDVLGRCLAKNPDRRYSSAGELRSDLEKVREGLFAGDRRGRATWTGRADQRKRAVAILGGAVLTAGFLLLRPLWTDSEYTFTSVTDGPLVTDTGQFACTAWGDYNGDGFVDLAVTDNAEGGFIHLFRNMGDGSFSQVTEGPMVTDPVSPMSLAWADQDNDGDLDLFATTLTRAADVFYRNNGEGEFHKELEGDWVSTPGSGISAAWGDYDNDGFVDLYVSNYGFPGPEPNYLYRNGGDGTMKAVDSEVSQGATHSAAALWTDYDDDGDLDLFVGNQEKTQFRNNGDGTFTWVSSENGGIPAISEGLGMAFASANFDNDRDLDIIYMRWTPDPSTVIYMNEFKRNFLESPQLLPADGATRGLTGAWGDYDNDGFQDLFIANNAGKNLLYHNEGNGHFERITDNPIVREGRPSSGASWADYDNDGDLDLLVANGLFAEFEESCEFYRNEGGSNNWILLSLVGTTSNRSAIGTKVWARATIGRQNMNQLREVSGGGQGNIQPDLRVHFGLGDAETIDLLRIEWPSGYFQEIRNVATNQFLTITEDTDQAVLDG